MRQILASLFSLLPLLGPLAQNIPVGAWRSHLAYANAQKVANAETKIYCSSINGLFVYDTESQSLETLGRLDGLSDTGIADLAYHSPTRTLVIAYQNGNIDLLREEEIINVRSLLNADKPDTRIFSLYLHQNTAYFATAFGGFSFNLQSLSPKDTYENIGGTPSQGQSFAVLDNRLYLSTNLGVYSVSLSGSVNQQDFNNWSPLPGLPSAPTHFVEHEGELYYAILGSGVFAYNQGSPILLPVTGGQQIGFMRGTGNGLAVGTQSAIVFLQNNTPSILQHEALSQANDASVLNGALWVADGQAGLLRIRDGQAEAFTPSGTLSSNAFRIFSVGEQIIAVAGGFDQNTLEPLNRSASFYLFEDGAWRNFSSQAPLGVVQLPEAKDITSVAYSPSEQAYYFGTMGQGLLIWEKQSDSFRGEASSPPLIADLALDGEGALWACDAQTGLYRRLNGVWQRIQGVTRPVEILIDRSNSQWIRLAGGGILLRNGSQQRMLRHSQGQGNLRGSRVRAMATDQLGSLWAGTNDGLTEFFDPFFTLDGEDGNTVFSSEGSPMNQGETVTAIAIDGGNRKWIGTENGGAWLYDANNRLLERFTSENSPLLSNNIQSIAIQPTTGEVFFATDQGIISYRGTATQGSNDFGQAIIFPNPVPPNFTGLISIEGLTPNAQVRITDAAGRLVWKGQAAGGRATWDGLGYEGGNTGKSAVQRGIYFVFATNADGSESFAGKIALVK